MTRKHFLVFFLFLAVSHASAADRRSAYVVFDAPCLAEHLMASTERARPVRQRLFEPEAETYRAGLRNGKADLMTRAAARGIVIEGQAETVINAVFVQATETELEWLRSQPGVKYADFAIEYKAVLDAALPLVGVPQVWTSLGGEDNAGRGEKIAIIDSGIDVTHPMFSDTGFTAPAGFPKTDTSRPQDASLTNNKIIVVRNFTRSTTEPDSNDHRGHGTFVAAVAAGRRAAGPLATIAGVAPGAFLGNYKVFGVSGSTPSTAVTQAMDAAALDGMDVINLSLGSQNAPAADRDPNLTSIRNAISLGLVVVVAAGNCGPNGSTDCRPSGNGTIASPGTLPEVLTVGASTNSRTFVQAVRVSASVAVPSALQAIPSLPGSDPVFASTVGPAVIADISDLDSSGLGCSTFPSGSLAGKIALIQRGSCNFTVKIANATLAGAVGVVVYNNKADFFRMDTTGATIPSVSILQTDGQALKAFIQPNKGTVQASLDARMLPKPETADQVADFSSRGPTLEMSIKPDVLTPGENIYSAAQSLDSTGDVYDPSRFTLADGTSFSAPLMAGAVAIVKQSRPTLNVKAVKSAIVNTATPLTTTQDGAFLSVMNAGAGRLNLPAAIATTLVSDPVSLSYGQQSVHNTLNNSQPLTLTNVGTQSETFVASLTSTRGDAAVKITLDKPTPFTLSAGASTTLSVSVSNTSALQSVYEGFINVKSQSSSTSIHMPYWLSFIPEVNTGGVVNGANFQPSVSPGAIVSLFGLALGGDPAGAVSIPLPTKLGGTSVQVNGSSVPLFFSSLGQLNIQLPFTLATGSATGRVTANDVASATFLLPVVDAAPGLFTSPPGGKGRGAILHAADSSPVTTTSPAKAGDFVSVFCTGLGAVNMPPAVGAPALSDPLSTTLVQPIVTIGGRTATVNFSGLGPGFAGLYQVNVQIPSGLPAGDQALLLSIGGAVGNSVTIPVQ